MSDQEIFNTIKVMRTYGGSFVAKLAYAMSAADNSNLDRLIAAFPDLVRKYGPKSDFYRWMLEQGDIS